MSLGTTDRHRRQNDQNSKSTSGVLVHVASEPSQRPGARPGDRRPESVPNSQYAHVFVPVLSENRRDRLAQRVQLSHRFATPIRIVLDVAAWMFAATVAVYLRFDLSIPDENRSGLIRVIPFVAGLQLLTVWRWALRRRCGLRQIAKSARGGHCIHPTGLFILNQYTDSAQCHRERCWSERFGLASMAGSRYILSLVLERSVGPTRHRLSIVTVAANGGSVITARSVVGRALYRLRSRRRPRQQRSPSGSLVSAIARRGKCADLTGRDAPHRRDSVAKTIATSRTLGRRQSRRQGPATVSELSATPGLGDIPDITR